MKPIFEALRLVALDKSENVRTLEIFIISNKKSTPRYFLKMGLHGLISESFKELLNEFDTDKSTEIFCRINLLKIA